MKTLKSFGKGMIALGFAFLLPELNTFIGDFTTVSATQLLLPMFGMIMIALYYFISPAMR